MKKMKIFFATSNPPYITEKDTGIWRRICFIPNEKCWETGNYTDDCNCNLCPHKDECSGYDNKEE